VNDAPGFVIGAAQTVGEDSGGQSVSGWITSISAGPADEGAQSVSFVVSVDDPALFAVVPAVAGDGTLSFTPALDANGVTTLRVTATDSGGASSAEQTATVSVLAVNDAPSAQDDGYTTQNDTPMTISAPGLLDNDWDKEDDPLTVTMVDDPANGSVVFAGDGSLTYTPDSGYSGTDTFNYTVVDGGGASAQGTIAVTVSSTSSSSSYYLRPGAPAANNWQLNPTASTDGSVLDYDNDGNPGLTIDKSDGKITHTDPEDYQNFDLTTTPLTLNGPVTLQLNATTAGFSSGKSAHIHAYLQDCASDGTNCVLLSATDVHVGEWSVLAGWTERTFNLGTVNHTITGGRILRLKILNDHNALWIAMSQANASRVNFTL
jgi:hypothetical protein